MDENNPHQRDRRESGSPPCPDRLLNRKIERCGLMQGFSSNLAKNGPSSGTKPSDRSVRAMVSLFEKSATISDNRPRLASGGSERVRVPDEEACQRSPDSDNYNKEATGRLQQPQQPETQLAHSKSTIPSMFPSAQVGYQVEDYSLTLLKHKSYFNNRPLARCLDFRADEDAKTKIQRVRSKKESAREPATEKKRKDRYEDDQGKNGNRDIAPPTKIETSSPIQQLDNLMSELLTWQEASESSAPKLDHQWERRNPEEVESFWSSVRTRLWVDEGEIYGERLGLATQGDGENEPEDENDNHTMKSSISATSLPAPDYADPELERAPPPPPTRPPPPVPAGPRERSFSATCSQQRQESTAPALELFPDPASDYPAWDEPPPTSSVRLSIFASGCLDITDLLSDGYHELELPTLPTPGRPLPTPPTERSHSRYPSNNSGPWTRPPTWRSPSSLRSSSPPPPVPRLPVPMPTPPTTGYHHGHRVNHSRNRHQQRSSKASASTSTSTHSVAVTDSSGKSMHSRRRTPKTSTSSTATRSTRADSGGADLAAYRARPPRRRLTTEEKLSEIDDFLSPEPDEKECWI
ncbi:hypothetical protein C8A00DRAFT_12772 [Chaetomidium leptoderma]|uniref:Uncharacterized protein n=1 Tax=Chaetomidium leptoderma TaxID=669021 RepID=A0AAN6VR32_9PEZI|nr:hypothetical protein C8A00DRAFT_12772 [Chaetomidium leptoderma]